MAGYAYAHAAPAWLGVRRHAVIHLLLLTAALGLVPLLLLPLHLPNGWPQPDDFHPILWLIVLLLASAGLPFVVVSTTSPLLQRWFTHTAAPAARDPYFLYGASNLGSILGLMAYPFLLEPTLSLAHQGWSWAGGYVLLIGLTTACAVCLWRAPPRKDEGGRMKDEKERQKSASSFILPPSSFRRLRWVLLAFTPSSLMLSVTAYLSTDVAAVPLLWVAPLTLYLLTFVLSFARRPPFSQQTLTRWMPLVVLPVVLTLLSQGTELPALLHIVVHLLALFWIGLVCHGELARDRPPAEWLTEFYLWLSVGGVLGGMFNALVAPLLFPGVWEYPIVLVLACVLRPAPQSKDEGGRMKDEGGRMKDEQKRRKLNSSFILPPSSFHRDARLLDWALPAGLALLTAGLVFGVQKMGVGPGPLSVALMFGAPLLFCYLFLFRPLRFGLGVAALLLAGSLYHGEYGGTELRLRSFFAVHRVTVDPTGHFRQLIHGDTVHGRQSLRPGEEHEPLTYYHRSGPIGQVLAALDYNDPVKRDPRLNRVGVVGLGAGSLCCYARRGEDWTFYEIDPAVRTIACDSKLFTFYPDCPAEKSVVLGDARLSLQRSQKRFGLLVIDAFGSDAIPVHLLTREAMKVYLDHLDPDGILAFNISNRYLDLQTVLADLARDSGPLACYEEEDRDAPKDSGKSPSQWVVLARDDAALEKVLGEGGNWQRALPRNGTASWSDDFSNLLGALKWNDFGQE